VGRHCEIKNRVKSLQTVSSGLTDNHRIEPYKIFIDCKIHTELDESGNRQNQDLIGFYSTLNPER
jgi:hypothetical protein